MKLLFKPLRFVLFICFTYIWLGFSIELWTSYMLSGKNLHYSRWDILGWIPSRGSEGCMIACCSLSLSSFGWSETTSIFWSFFSVCNSCSEPHCMGHCAWAGWRMKKELHGKDCCLFYLPFITSEHMIVCFIKIDSSSINWCRIGNMFLLFVQRWVYSPDVWS
jgi:hypothetical protein